MSKKRKGPRKHIPQRTCVGCRQVLPKRELIRIVHTAEGVQVDLTGKEKGRGAYLHKKRKCWTQALKGALASTLKIELSNQDIVYLKTYMQDIPESSEE
ncbi:MAG TPA: YlxR family protein [Anaerolineae bacterium]|nr:YlxR family protein [Anaerolineae bacterium]